MFYISCVMAIYHIIFFFEPHSQDNSREEFQSFIPHPNSSMIGLYKEKMPTLSSDPKLIRVETIEKCRCFLEHFQKGGCHVYISISESIKLAAFAAVAGVSKTCRT